MLDTTLDKYILTLEQLDREFALEMSPLELLRKDLPGKHKTVNDAMPLLYTTFRTALELAQSDEDRCYIWLWWTLAARISDLTDAWIGQLQEQDKDSFLVSMGKTKGNPEGRVRADHQMEVKCIGGIPTFLRAVLKNHALPTPSPACIQRIFKLLNSLPKPEGDYGIKHYTTKSFKVGAGAHLLKMIIQVNKQKLPQFRRPLGPEMWSIFLKHKDAATRFLAEVTERHYARRELRSSMLNLAQLWRSYELTALMQINA
jgi:hypothetical protein